MKFLWIRVFPKEILARSVRFKANYLALYYVLLALMYEEDNPIEEDPKLFSNITRLSMPVVRAGLDALCQKGLLERPITGFLWAPEAQREKDNRQKYSREQAAKANARWGKEKQNQASKDAAALQREYEIPCGKGERPRRARKSAAASPTTVTTPPRAPSIGASARTSALTPTDVDRVNITRASAPPPWSVGDKLWEGKYDWEISKVIGDREYEAEFGWDTCKVTIDDHGSIVARIMELEEMYPDELKYRDENAMGG
jgi:hypothetical protein